MFNEPPLSRLAHGVTRRHAMQRLMACAAVGAGGGMASPAWGMGQAEAGKAGQAPESLRISVPGWHATQAMPLWCADRLGFFAQQGLSVAWSEDATDVLALQRLQRGELDLAMVGLSSLLAGGSEGPLAWRVLLQPWRAPQAVLLVSRRAVQRYLAPVQLAGGRIGIAVPGAAGSHVAWAALHKGGVKASEVEWVHLASTEDALAALGARQVEALVTQDPVVSLLERDLGAQIAADTRTQTGTRALFGADWVGACVVARSSWVAANAQRTQAAVSALVRALKWLQTAQAGDLVKVLPEHLGLGKPADHVLAFEKARSALSGDGLPADGDVGAMLEGLRGLNTRPAPGDWRRALAPQFARQAQAQLAGRGPV